MERDGVGRHAAGSTAPRISVIIATRDRPEDLGRCLASVLACDHDSFEVVVVDQSDPVVCASDDSRVVHIPSDTRGKSAALNVGLTVARADLLAFTDDDCTVPSDWLDKIEQVFVGHPDVAMLFGELRPIPHDPTEVFIPEAEIDCFEIAHHVRRGHFPSGPGANMAARREIFEAIGRYDEQLGPGSRFSACEELDINYRAVAGGQGVAAVPELTVTHWGVRPWADGSGRNLKRSYAYGRGAVVGKHLRMGDPRILPVVARMTAEDLRVIANGLAHRRLWGLGHVAHMWRGVAKGVIAPVDRRHHVFAK